MTDLPPPYPLLWPEGQRRTGRPGEAQFRTTRHQAIQNVEKSLEDFGRDSGIRVGGVQITSSVAGLRSGEPADPGVAIWFFWDGDLRCIAVDRYSKVEWNLQAIHHVLEADRTKIRHGGLEMVRAAWRGLTLALRAPGDRPWHEVLGVPATATADQIDAAWKARARDLAARGDEVQMKELNVARDKAKKERGNG